MPPNGLASDEEREALSYQATEAAFASGIKNRTELLIYVSLATYADPNGDNAFPSVATLAARARVSERTVQRILRALERRGLLIARARIEGGRGRSTVYSLTASAGATAAAPARAEPLPKWMTHALPALRSRVIAAFGRVCSYCRCGGDAAVGPDGRAWHVDRIVPGAEGGYYTDDNVTLSCGTCNRRRRGEAMRGIVAESLAARERVPSGGTPGAGPVAERVPTLPGKGATLSAPEPSSNRPFGSSSQSPTGGPGGERVPNAPTARELARIARAFAGEASAAWEATARRLANPYVDTFALRRVRQQAAESLRWADEATVIAAIRGRMDGKSSPVRIPEWSRMEAAAREERRLADARAEERRRRAAEPMDPRAAAMLRDLVAAMRSAPGSPARASLGAAFA